LELLGHTEYYQEVSNVNETLTAAEAAKFLKISKYTLYELVKKGELPAHHIGRQLRIDPLVLDRYLKGTLNLTTAQTSDTRTSSSSDSPLIRFVGSHDPVVELLFEFMKHMPTPTESSVIFKGSMDGLIALYRKEAEITGIHLWDEEIEDYNISFVKHIIFGEQVSVINLVQREQGFIVAPGNPFHFGDWEDLTKEGLRFINRQKGSGTRLRTDAHLKAAGIKTGRILGYSHEESTHAGVAYRVASGKADVGVGLKSAAQHLGLDFIPIFKERYDLVCLKDIVNSAIWRQLLEVMKSPGFIKAVQQQGGYDTSMTGKILYNS